MYASIFKKKPVSVHEDIIHHIVRRATRANYVPQQYKIHNVYSRYVVCCYVNDQKSNRRKNLHFRFLEFMCKLQWKNFERT